MAVILACQAGDTDASTAWMLTCAIPVSRVSMKASTSVLILRNKGPLVISLYLYAHRVKNKLRKCLVDRLLKLRTVTPLLETPRGGT